MEYRTPALFNQGLSAKVFLFVYIVLSVVLILVDSRLQTLEPIRMQIRSVLSPILTVTKLPSSVSQSFDSLVLSRAQLRVRVYELEKQVFALKEENLRNQALRTQNDQLREQLSIARKFQPESVRAVEIRGPSGDRFERKMIINAGMDIGLRPGMAVFNEKGLLGQVCRVYQDQSDVFLLSSKNIQVPAVITRTGQRVVCEGIGERNRLRILHLSQTNDIQIGDELVTSGIDGVHPAKTSIGTVSSILTTPGSAVTDIELTMSADVEDSDFALVYTVSSTKPKRGERGENSPIRTRRRNGLP